MREILLCNLNQTELADYLLEGEDTPTVTSAKDSRLVLNDRFVNDDP